MTKYTIYSSKRFNRDLKTAERRGYNIGLIRDILVKLSNGEPLAPKHKDHPLSGKWTGCRECHITPDWLLIYKKKDAELILYLTRTGTHSDLGLA